MTTFKLSGTQKHALRLLADGPARVGRGRPFNWATVRVLQREGLAWVHHGTVVKTWVPDDPRGPLADIKVVNDYRSYVVLTDEGWKLLKEELQ